MRENRISDPERPDFKLLRRPVVEEIRKMPEHNRFFRALVDYVGFKRVDFSFSVDDRDDGTSRFSTKASLRLAMNAILSNTALLLMPLVAGMDLRICGGGAVYGILASLLLSRRLRTPDEAILPLLFVQISGWILYAVFLRWPAAGALAALAALYWLRRK